MSPCAPIPLQKRFLHSKGVGSNPAPERGRALLLCILKRLCFSRAGACEASSFSVREAFLVSDRQDAGQIAVYVDRQSAVDWRQHDFVDESAEPFGRCGETLTIVFAKRHMQCRYLLTVESRHLRVKQGRPCEPRAQPSSPKRTGRCPCPNRTAAKFASRAFARAGRGGGRRRWKGACNSTTVNTVRRCLALCIFAYGNRESSLMTRPSQEPKMWCAKRERNSRHLAQVGFGYGLTFRSRAEENEWKSVNGSTSNFLHEVRHGHADRNFRGQQARGNNR
jgi:hypothetical protein